jgi:hypothetical protein
MRKFALLLAASLIVTAPLVAMSTTDTYAAAKAKKAAAKGDKGAKDSGGDPNTAFVRALGDIGKTPDAGKDKKAKAGKSGGGKKTAKASKKAKKAA